MSRLGIVIVNWNSREQLRECLGSLPAAAGRLASSGWTVQTVVVDNGSEDGSESGLPAETLLLRNAENRGFAAACNQGARALGDCELLLFLNPDTRLYPDSLAHPVRWLIGQTRVGIAGIQLEDEHGVLARSCARFPRLRHFFVQALGLERLYPAWGHAMREWDHRDSRQVDQVIGAFFLIRGPLFRQLGGFDERFFVYFEEVDLARRASLAGWNSHFLADVRAFHKGGGTSDQVKAHRLFYSLRSRLAYFDKHGNGMDRIGIRLVTWGLEPLSRGLHLLLRRRWRELHELLRAYRMLLA